MVIDAAVMQKWCHFARVGLAQLKELSALHEKVRLAEVALLHKKSSPHWRDEVRFQ